MSEFCYSCKHHHYKTCRVQGSDVEIEICDIIMSCVNGDKFSKKEGEPLAQL